MKFLFKALILACVIPFTIYASAQQDYSSVKDSGTVIISGTSNLHDWEMTMDKFNCNLKLSSGNASLKIHSVSFSGESKSIQSNNSIMNRKTYDALQAEQYPEIRFENSSPKDVQFNTPTFEGTLSGDLFLSGKTSKVNVPFSGKMVSDGKIRISGSKRLKMSDYNIDPPKAMFGTLKTGDEVTISFNLFFMKEEFLQSLNQ